MVQKEKIIALIIFALGSLGVWALFLNQPQILARVQSLGTLPLPLVFDAPKGYQFWSNQYRLTLITDTEEISIPITKEVYQQFPKNVVIFNSLAIPLVMIPIQEKHQWYPVAKKLFCNPQSKLLSHLVNRPLTLKKVIIDISNSQNHWQAEIKCL